jgi:NMD protein affecting ribosome stability and mRNA decay
MLSPEVQAVLARCRATRHRLGKKPLHEGVCTKCGGLESRLRWQASSDGQRHLRAECATCGRFFRYVEQTPVRIAAAE